MYHDLNCLAEQIQQQAKTREFIKSKAVLDEEAPRLEQCRLQPMRGSRRFELILRMQGL